MYFREEYFERKLQNVREEMSMISNQLFLIQDFIVEQFGSKFNDYCESRRGGDSSFQERNESREDNGGRSDGSRRIGNTSIIPLGTNGSGVNGNMGMNMEGGVADKDSCKSNTTDMTRRKRLSSSVSVNSKHFRKSRPFKLVENSRDCNPTNVSKGTAPSVLTCSENWISQVQRAQTLNSVDIQSTVSSAISILSDTKVKKEFIDESEGDNIEYALDYFGDPETNVDIHTEVVVKCDPRSFSVIEGFSTDANQIEESISQPEFMTGPYSEEPCSSNSMNQSSFQTALILTSSNSSLSDFGIDPEDPEDKDESYSTRAKGQKKGPTNTRKRIKKKIDSSMALNSCNSSSELLKQIPWKNNYRTLPNGNVMCTVKDCNTKLRDLYRFKRHFITHTGIKPYKCDFCSMAFARNEHLVLHKSRKHREFNVA